MAEEKKEMKEISPQVQIPKQKTVKKDFKEAEKIKKEEREQMIEIVRLHSTDLNGKLKIKNSLRKIRGISFTIAKIFCEKAKVDQNKKTGNLTEEEIKRLEDVIKNPTKYNIPNYVLNLRKNPYTGSDNHLTGAELEIETRKIIGDLKKLGSYVGVRHRLGLPVRGQRTRSSFRKNRTIGVAKKKQLPAVAAAK